MGTTKHDLKPAIGVLATDLDGTFIPLDGNARNRADLKTLAGQLESRRVTLVYVTGRHFESALSAIQQFHLPTPDWLICDVGTSIFKQESGQFGLLEQHQDHQRQITASLPIEKLRGELGDLEGLRLQEAEKQGSFKLSFYADAARLAELVANLQSRLDQLQAPYSIIRSVDPFNGDGLVDVLPTGVSKAYALYWWVNHTVANSDDVVFAGDSGNDLAALTAGYRAIVVGNADRSIAKAADHAHRESGWTDRLHLSQAPATSGVLEGCIRFGLIEPL